MKTLQDLRCLGPPSVRWPVWRLADIKARLLVPVLVCLPAVPSARTMRRRLSMMRSADMIRRTFNVCMQKGTVSRCGPAVYGVAILRAIGHGPRHRIRLRRHPRVTRHHRRSLRPADSRQATAACDAVGLGRLHPTDHFAPQAPLQAVPPVWVLYDLGAEKRRAENRRMRDLTT